MRGSQILQHQRTRSATKLSPARSPPLVGMTNTQRIPEWKRKSNEDTIFVTGNRPLIGAGGIRDIMSTAYDFFARYEIDTSLRIHWHEPVLTSRQQSAVRDKAKET
jgi:hypothetical protein